MKTPFVSGGMLNVAAALKYDLDKLSKKGWQRAELREIEETPSFGFGNMPGGGYGFYYGSGYGYGTGWGYGFGF